MNYFLQKLRLFSNVDLINPTSQICVDTKSRIILGKNSKVIIHKGVLKLGGKHPRSDGMPSLNETVLLIGDGGTLEINGDVFIGAGTYICIKKNSKLVFGGGNYIGNDNKIFCHKETSIGVNSSTSWHVTLMEDDGHDMFNLEGKVIKKMHRKLIIGQNVGIQMNVTIPRGVTVGDNVLIGANTVIRKDISPNVLVYSETMLKEKYGYSAGLQFN